MGVLLGSILEHLYYGNIFYSNRVTEILPQENGLGMEDKVVEGH
jgi:hypothetical protein